MTTQWDALTEVPRLLMRDWPSIIVHSLLSKAEDMIVDYSRRTFPSNDLVPFLVDGINYTLRQDYLIALTKQQDKLPSSAEVKASIFGGTVAY